MRDIKDIIAELGGPTAVARLFEPALAWSTVGSWPIRKSIPVEYWPRLIEASSGALTPEILMQANASEARRSHEAAAE